MKTLTRLTTFSVRHRWLMVLTWIMLVVAAVVAFAQLGMKTTEPADQLVGDSAKAAKITEAADFGDLITEQVVITVKEPITDENQARIVTAAKHAYQTEDGELLEGVKQILPAIRGADGNTVVLPVAIKADNDDKTDLPEPRDVVGPMLKATKQLASDHPEWEVGQFGQGSIDVGVGDVLENDLRKAELYSLPITLGILLFVFGALVAAGVPLLLGVFSVATAFGITALTSHQAFPVDPNAQSLILLIGLAVAVDYALFLLRRAREERRNGADKFEAIIRAGQLAGHAVVISGLTVMVAMTGMLVAGGLYASLAIGTIAVIAVSVVASMTLLPALLAILGDKVESLRVPFLNAWRARRDPDQSWSGRLARRVSKRPLPWMLVVGGLLGALALPALGMKTALPGIAGLPADMPAVQTYQRLTEAIPTEGETISLVVKAEPSQFEDVRQSLAQASDQALELDHVTATSDKPEVSLDRRVSVLQISTDLSGSDKRLPGVIDQVRTDLAGGVEDRLPAAQVHVGGIAAETDLAEWMTSRLPLVVGFVLLVTFVVMLWSFGSPWLALATIGLNALSVGAAYGLLTVVFQNDWAEGLLDFTSIGSIASWLPVLMFVVLFGLSMDYHVFVTSRVREAYFAGHSPREAVRIGVSRSASVVTSAAAVMVGVFALFAAQSTLEMKQLGVGLAAAILLDATVVRGVLLPAVLSLLGERSYRGFRGKVKATAATVEQLPQQVPTPAVPADLQISTNRQP